MGPAGRIDGAPDAKEALGEALSLDSRTLAGDTFCASVVNYVLENGLDGLGENQLKEMLRFANAAAYLVTTKKGAIRSMPDPEQVQEILANN